MGHGVSRVVEAVAVSALQTLAQEAVNLLGNVRGEKRHFQVEMDTDSAGCASTIWTYTQQYVENNFANNYGYYYAGLTSQPVTQHMMVSSAFEDIIVFDQTDGLSNIDTYLKDTLQGSLSDSDSIFVSKNLTDIFQERFKETSLAWVPLLKRFNTPSGTIIDCYMVTAAAESQGDGSIAGIATYCFVAYSPTQTKS